MNTRKINCAMVAASIGCVGLFAGGSSSAGEFTNQLFEAQSPEFGEVFSKGTLRAGFSLGAGPGFAMCGSNVSHDLALWSVSLSRMLTDVLGENHWHRGNWELAGELFGGAQIRPETRYVGGVTPLLRYNFVTGTRWVPFVTGGVGVCFTDIGGPDLSGTFQFDPQAGFGTHYFLTRKTSLTFEYRWLHISNAGLSQPNDGLNTHMFSMGMAWFF